MSPITGKSPVFAINVNGTGFLKNNPTIDAAYRAVGAVGNYVWSDTNGDGLQSSDENGINGVVVQLWSSSTGMLVATTVTANNGTNDGYYNFEIKQSDNYYIKFPLTVGTSILTTADISSATDGNSDADSGNNGQTDVFYIDVNGTGTNRYNYTIDAGYKGSKSSLGNYVWLDINADGNQDSDEPGVAGINVTLYDATTNEIMGTTVTDAYGKYLFTGLDGGDYRVAFTPPTNYIFTGKGLSTSDSDSDVASNGLTSIISLPAGENDMTIDAGIVLKPNTSITTSLGDRIWNDINNDGMQNLGEDGVAGVIVSLYDNAGDVVATTITDGTGNYLFANLLPATYRVGATLPAGYVFTNKNIGTANTNSDINTSGAYFGMTDLITLTAGTNRTDIDGGIRLASPATSSVGSYVWNDMDNDGARELGEAPISGVTVTLFSGSGTVIGTTVTNALGQYIFTNLPEGDYYVTFSQPSGYDFVIPNLSNDNTDSDVTNSGTGATDVFHLPVGIDKLDVDAGLYNSSLPTNSISGSLWKDANTDGIQDTDESPILGATVTLYNSTGVAISTTVTDLNGNYAFNNLPNGTYTVGFSNTPTNYVFSSDNQGTDETVDSDAISGGRTSSISLTGGTHVTDVDGGLYEGSSASYTASLGDKVWYDLNNNGIQESGELGVPNVTVNLLDDAGTILKTDITDTEGNYMFTGLAAGAYIIEFVKSSLPSGYSIVAANQSDDAADSDADITTGRTAILNLVNGQDDLTIDAGIFKNDPTRGNLGNLVWNDLNNDGIQNTGEVGVRGISVTLYDNTGSVVATTTTDANGNYLFTDLPAATDYSIVFANLPDGFAFVNTNVGSDRTLDSDANSAGRVINITVTGGATNNDIDAGIRSTSRGSLGNYVWADDNKNGIQDSGENGIAGVTVILYDGSNIPVASAITDADGHYLFTNLIPANDYQVAFSTIPTGASFTIEGAGNETNDSDANALTGRTSNITVVAGELNSDVDAGVVLPQTGTISNYVWKDADKDGIQDTNEFGLGGVVVKLLDASNNVIAVAVTDATGNYLFTKVPAGTYSVEFSQLPLGYSFTTQTTGTDNGSDANTTTGRTPSFTLAMGETKTDIDAGVVSSGSIGNFVWLDADKNGHQEAGETGIANVTVNLLNEANAVIATTTTDANGLYLFTELLAGVYSVDIVEASLPSGLTATTVVSAGTDFTSQTQPYRVILGENEQNLTADFGYFYNLGTIGDRVWADANGNGIQESNEIGINGVTVSIYYDANNDGVIDTNSELYTAATDANGNTGGVTTTDGNGNYLFTDLPAGMYKVVVTNIPAGYTQTGDPDSHKDDMTTAPVILDANENYLAVDFGYQPTASYLIGDYVWFDNNGDGVQDATETGIPNVTISLFNSNGDVMASTTTASDGSYSFAGISNGTYTVRVTDVWNVLGSLSQTFDADGSLNRQSVVTINDADNLNQDFGFKPASQTPTTGLIGDQVFLDRDNDGSYTNGEGLSGVVLVLYNAAGSPIAVTTTDATGYYYFAGLDPTATYVVKVETSTLPRGLRNSVDPDGGNDDMSKSILGATTNGIDLSQDFGYIPDTPFSLGNLVFEDFDKDGVFTTGTDLPIQGVTLSLYYDANMNGVLDNGDVTMGNTTTDVNGNYLFANLPSDLNYLVIVTDLDNKLNDYYKTLGATDTDDNSQVEPYAVFLSSDILYADFGYYKKPYNPILLPVEIISFKATEKDCSILLSWETAVETNVAHYVIEKSEDGTQYREIARIVPSTATDIRKMYKWIDKNAKPENYYRLYEVSTDGQKGQFVHTFVKSTCYDGVVLGDTPVLYPNPTKGGLTMKFHAPTTDNTTQIIIVDALGRMVKSIATQVNEGANLVELDVTDLADGSYFIQLKGENWKSTMQKFVKILD